MTALSRCVGDVERFLSRYWSTAPLHRRRAGASGFTDLLSLDDVDHLLSTSPRLPSFRLVRDGRPVDPARYTRATRLGGKNVAGVGDPVRIFEEFAEGATIVLQGLQRSWLPLARFCRELEGELTHPVQANAYITPPGARGLAVHYDTHDVFVLQVAGHKHWGVHHPVVDDPLPSQPWSAARGEPGDPFLSVDVEAGDTLYLPRGFPHSAQAQEGVSAHLTIGVHTRTWNDVVRHVMAGLADEAEFRRPLPAGFAHDQAGLASAVAERLGRLREWLEKVDPDTVAAGVVDRFWSGVTPVLTGQLRQVLNLDRLDDTSVVATREGAVCRIDAHGERMRLALGDRRLEMPAPLEPVVSRMLSMGRFRVGDLAGLIDGPSRLVLVRRLVREGLLEVEAEAGVEDGGRRR